MVIPDSNYENMLYVSKNGEQSVICEYPPKSQENRRAMQSKEHIGNI